MTVSRPSMLPHASVSVDTYLNRGTQAYRTHIIARQPSTASGLGKAQFSISMSFDGRGDQREVEREAIRVWNQRFGD